MGETFFSENPFDSKKIFAEDEIIYKNLKKDWDSLIASVYADNKEKIEKFLANPKLFSDFEQKHRSPYPEGRLREILPDEMMEIRGCVEECWQILQDPDNFLSYRHERFQNFSKEARTSMATFRSRIEERLGQEEA